MSDFLPSPPLSPPPSALFLQDKLQYTRHYLNCLQQLLAPLDGMRQWPQVLVHLDKLSLWLISTLLMYCSATWVGMAVTGSIGPITIWAREFHGHLCRLPACISVAVGFQWSSFLQPSMVSCPLIDYPKRMHYQLHMIAHWPLTFLHPPPVSTVYFQLDYLSTLSHWHMHNTAISSRSMGYHQLINLNPSPHPALNPPMMRAHPAVPGSGCLTSMWTRWILASRSVASSPINIALSRRYFKTTFMCCLSSHPFMITVTTGWVSAHGCANNTLDMDTQSVIAGQHFSTKRSEARGNRGTCRNSLL